MEILNTLNSWIWVAQGLLGLFYFAIGSFKSFFPISEIAKKAPNAADQPRLTRFIGYAEICGAIGLVAPLLTGILVWLTPLAAVGLSVIQVLAIAFHARRGETAKTLPVNTVLLALSAFIAWTRWPLLSA